MCDVIRPGVTRTAPARSDGSDVRTMTGAARLYTFGQSEASSGYELPIRSWENLHIETVWCVNQFDPKRGKTGFRNQTQEDLWIYVSARCKRWYFYVSGLLRTSQTFLHKSMNIGQQAARLGVSQVTLSIISGVSWECFERWSPFPSQSQSTQKRTDQLPTRLAMYIHTFLIWAK